MGPVQYVFALVSIWRIYVMIASVVRGPYVAYPLLFLCLATLLVAPALLVALLYGVADTATVQYTEQYQQSPLLRRPSAASGRRAGHGYVPHTQARDVAAFVEANVNATVLCATALLCMTVWLCQCVARGWSRCVVPLLRDMALLECTVWRDAVDLRNCTAGKDDSVSSQALSTTSASPLLVQRAHAGNNDDAHTQAALTQSSNDEASTLCTSTTTTTTTTATTPMTTQQPQSSSSASDTAPVVAMVRMAREPNTAVVLHVGDSGVVTIDLCVCTGNEGGDVLVKSMMRIASEPAAGTLDRIRLLFQPRQQRQRSKSNSSSSSDDGNATPKKAQQQQQQTKKSRAKSGSGNDGGTTATQQQMTTREAVLARCPPVSVLGVVADEDAKDDAGQTSAAATGSNKADEQLVALDTSLSNAQLWRRARVLCIGATRVRVRYNVPTISQVTPPSCAYVGLPLVCSHVVTHFAQDEHVQYEWCVRRTRNSKHNKNNRSKTAQQAHDKDGDDAAQATSTRTDGGGSGDDGGDVRVLSTDTFLVPDASLLGCRLLLRLTVDREAGLWTCVELPPVQPPPLRATRWRDTASYVAYPSFRVLTYNILYDEFCTSAWARQCIYPFATDDVLDPTRRQARVLQELLAAHADVLCLQECGRRLFTTYLQPCLRVCGYEGEYANKSGKAQEGCAIFWRRERYTCVSSHSMTLNWATLEAAAAGAAATKTTTGDRGSSEEELASLAAQLAPHTELREALAHMTAIATVHVLRERNSVATELVVGNTHLFYHTNACHIRALQLYMLLHKLHRAAAEGKATTSAAGTPTDALTSSLSLRPVVLCGDLNCTHRTAAYRLATTGQVEQSHPSWSKGALFWWGCDRMLGVSDESKNTAGKPSHDGKKSNEKTTKATTTTQQPKSNTHNNNSNDTTTRVPPTTFFRGHLHAPLRLADAYDRTDPALPWTNYTATFREVIDYIFFSDETVNVLRTLPIPPEAELAAAVALPNAQHPSDHLALVADLAFK